MTFYIRSVKFFKLKCGISSQGKNITCQFHSHQAALGDKDVRDEIAGQIITYLDEEFQKRDFDEKKRKGLLTIIEEIVKNFYDHAEFIGTLSLTFSDNICRFTAWDTNNKEYDFDQLLADAIHNDTGIKKIYNILNTIFRSNKIISEKGIKYSGELAYQ